MNLKIDIPENQLDKMVSFFKEEREKALAKISELNKEVYDIDKLLESVSSKSRKSTSFPVVSQPKFFGGSDDSFHHLKPQDSSPFIPILDTGLCEMPNFTIKMTSGYDKQGSWPAKAEFVLRHFGFAMSVRQIVDAIVKEFEPELNNEEYKRSIAGKISAVLKMKYDKRSVFTRYMDYAEKEIKYALIDWEDEVGDLPSSYKK